MQFIMSPYNSDTHILQDCASKTATIAWFSQCNKINSDESRQLPIQDKAAAGDMILGMGMLVESLRWRHNGCDSLSNHHTQDCLLNRLFGRRSKKTSKLRVTGLCVGNSREPVNSPHKGPVTRKMFPFDDVTWLRSPAMCFTSHCNRIC